MQKSIKKLLFGCFAAAVMLGNFKSEVKAAENRITEYTGYEVVNVTSYGADKSGTKDSQPAFKKAVAAAAELQEKGEKAVVYIPSGTFVLNKYVAVRGIEITFVAEDDTTVKAKSAINVQIGGAADIVGGIWQYTGSASDKKTMFFGNNNAEVSLKNLKIVNPYKAVNVTKAKCNLEQITVQGSPYIAVAAIKNSQLTIKDSNFNKNTMAVMVSASTADIDNVTIQKSKNMGMEAIEKSKVVVSNSKILNNGSGYQPGKTENKGHGIGIYTKSDVTLNNTVMKKNDQCGVSLLGANVTLNQCEVSYNGRQGIGTREKCKVTAKKTTINHNGFDTEESANGHNGLILVDGSSATLTGCKVTNNKYAGVWANGKGVSLKVKKCTFKGNKMFPISLETNKGKISLTSDSCTYSNSPYGVRFLINGSGKYKLVKKGKNKFSKIPEKFYLQKGNGKIKRL